MVRDISARQARALALRGVALDTAASASSRGLASLISTLGTVQIDSVNVFDRSHHLVVAARTGGTPHSTVDALLHHDSQSRVPGIYTETWAHEAAVVSWDDYPLFAFRRRAFRQKYASSWGEHAQVISAIREQIEDRGPLTASEIEHEANVSLGGGWWNKNIVHRAAMWMFLAGELTCVGRERFRRVYEIPERSPAAGVAEPTAADAQRELIARAARHLGVATVGDLRDYYRIRHVSAARTAVRELVEEGVLQQVRVEGWDEPGYMVPGTLVPRREPRHAAFLSPFDPLVWCRPRAQRLFGFDYKISIYTPAHLREHGYYVLPVLVGDALVARIDLKSDRKAGMLRVQQFTWEAGAAENASSTLPELRSAITALTEAAAAWQGLRDVVWTPDAAERFTPTAAH